LTAKKALSLNLEAQTLLMDAHALGNSGSDIPNATINDFIYASLGSFGLNSKFKTICLHRISLADIFSSFFVLLSRVIRRVMRALPIGSHY